MESIQKNPGIYLIEGILLVILGIFAILMPIVSTLSITFILGWVLLIGGIYKFFRAIKLRKQLSHFTLQLLSGIVAALIGIFFLTHIIKGVFLLTLFLAIFFIVDGIASIYMAMTARITNYWGFLLFSGIITLILAVLIISGLPGTAAWVPGLFLGINLLFTGFSLAFAAGTTNQRIQKYGT